MSRFFALLVLSGLACAQTPSSSLPASSPPASSLPETPAPSPSLPVISWPVTASLAPPSAGPAGPVIVSNSPNDTNNLLPELPAVPNRDVSLIGGTIRSLDRVRDQITIQVFGGGKAQVFFDPRTHVYRDGAAASARDLQAGERVYVDTVLDGTDIFAKNIRVVGQGSMAQSSGQIVDHEPGSEELTFRDAIFHEPVRLRLDSNTVVTHDNRAVSANELLPGTLVSVDSRPDGKGHAVVQQISILAIPGSTFYFSGRVAHLDLSRGLLVVVDPRDEKSYEISFDASTLRANPNLREGADIMVTASFDGARYLAKAITINSAAGK